MGLVVELQAADRSVGRGGSGVSKSKDEVKGTAEDTSVAEEEIAEKVKKPKKAKKEKKEMKDKKDKKDNKDKKDKKGKK